MGGDAMSVSVLALAAARASWEDAAFQESSRKRNAETRAVTVASLKELGLSPAASHTNFVYFPYAQDVEALGRALEKERVKIVARPSIGGCRVTIGTPDEMRIFTSALRRARA
jgi:histidinol-phosphate aminotransferase